MEWRPFLTFRNLPRNRQRLLLQQFHTSNCDQIDFHTENAAHFYRKITSYKIIFKSKFQSRKPSKRLDVRFSPFPLIIFYLHLHFLIKTQHKTIQSTFFLFKKVFYATIGKLDLLVQFLTMGRGLFCQVLGPFSSFWVASSILNRRGGD